MIENNYNNKISFQGQKSASNGANCAYEKLLEYQKSMKKSDLSSSKTRYSRELELIQDAIDEAQRKNQSELLKTLEGLKERAAELLDNISHPQKERAIPFNTFFVKKTPKVSKNETKPFDNQDGEPVFSKENKEIYEELNDEELARFNRARKKFHLTGDSAIEYIGFDKEKLNRFTEIKSRFKDIDNNFAVVYSGFNKDERRIFENGLNNFALSPEDAIDFVTAFRATPVSELPAEQVQKRTEYLMLGHGELQDIIDDDLMSNIVNLADYGVNIPDILDNNGDLSRLWKKHSGSIRGEIVDDIAKLNQVYRNINLPPSVISTFSDNEVINSALKETMKDVFVPYIKTQAELDKLEIGDTFRTKDAKGDEHFCVADKTTDGKMVGISFNISADKYLELFPPVLKYSAAQNRKTGDCFLVSTLNILCSDKTKIKHVLDKFKENPDGSVTVSLNGDVSYTFDDEVTDSHNLKGSKGMQALEVVYGSTEAYKRYCEIANHEWHNRIEKLYEDMAQLEKQYALEEDYEKAQEIKKQINELEDKLSDLNYNIAKYTAMGKDITTDLDEIYKIRTNGGTFSNACRMFSQGDIYSLSTYKNMPVILEQNPYAKFYMRTSGNSDKIDIDKDLNMVQKHAYMLEYENGKYYAINPWISAQRIEIPEDKLDKYAGDIYYLDS